MQSFFSCDGPGLPRRLPCESQRVHLEGCAISRTSHGLRAELVLTVDPIEPSTTIFHLQHAQAAQSVALRVAGWRCRSHGEKSKDGKTPESPTIGVHAVVVRCECRRCVVPRLLSLSIASASPEKAEGIVLVERKMSGGSLMACTGRVLYGDLEKRVRLQARSSIAWQSVGVTHWWTFAQSKAGCEALRAVDGTTCEVRGTIEPSRDLRTEHLCAARRHHPIATLYIVRLHTIPCTLCLSHLSPANHPRSRPCRFEQPVRHLLCLAYARAAVASFLALVDADEFPPLQLRHLLERVGQFAVPQHALSAFVP